MAFIIKFLSQGIFAILSSGFFFASWLWQVYISKKAKQSKVDFWFWLLRLLAIIFLSFHAIKRNDMALLVMNIFGLIVYFYNVLLTKK